MLRMSRRDVVVAAGLATALGLNHRLAMVRPAHAQEPPNPAKGFYRYKVGAAEVTALYDGIWKKPHDPTFIKNASVDDTKAALGKAGMITEYMPIPLTVVVLKVRDRFIMVDAGSGVGQWQPTAISLPGNMKAAGIDPATISTILISHFRRVVCSVSNERRDTGHPCRSSRRSAPPRRATKSVGSARGGCTREEPRNRGEEARARWHLD